LSCLQKEQPKPYSKVSFKTCSKPVLEDSIILFQTFKLRSYISSFFQRRGRANNTSISNGAHYVTPDSKIYCEKVKKCAGLTQEIGLSAPNSCSLPWLVKGAIQMCTSKKESNELDLTAL
jgi:hypothetical protein